MLIRAGFDIQFNLPQPTEVLAQVSLLPEYAVRLLAPEQFSAQTGDGSPLPAQQYVDRFGNLCHRIQAMAGSLRLFNDFVVADTGAPNLLPIGQYQHAVSEIPNEHLVFLLPSRYCESDRLSGMAWSLFGHTPLGWPRVQAVLDWVHGNVQFGYQFASVSKTAAEVAETRQGVCRDFAHLAISFCRALNIPARYATGYLGDIGVPFNPAPMDFSACIEVFLGGQWWLLDARHNRPRVGWLLMARGRDAADCAITTAFGAAPLVQFKVWTYAEEQTPVMPHMQQQAAAQFAH